MLYTLYKTFKCPIFSVVYLKFNYLTNYLLNLAGYCKRALFAVV